VLLGWAIVVPLLLVAVARVVAWDARSVLIAVNALTPFVFLPAWPVAVGAGVARRWALVGAASVVALAQVALVVPELAARSAVPAAVPGVRAVRLFTANVYAWNDRPGGIAEEIRASRPDVVFLQESTPAIVDAMDASGALEDLPYRLAVSRNDPFGGLVAARWPLLDHEVVEIDGRPVLLRATVETEGGPLRLYAVHVVAPFGGGRGSWMNEVRAITDAVRTERLPILMAGDFNATWGNRAFRRLLDAGLTDAAAARGRPFQMTWRQGGRVPPLTRIDHVLTTDGLAVVAIRTGEGRGSDHRPIVADIVRTAGAG
jgi:endonuclease/exonuclease/phosphatase (EEP) superfamily protein YafD